MKKQFINYFILSAIVFLISSCNPMKKDVMNDICDDVEEAVISRSNGKYALVTREEIFQAQTKSSENGIRQITGYTEYRISSYDLNTGVLKKRIVLGDRKENESAFLGMTEGRLWYKSVNPELGFHARDPVTLDVIVTENNITSVNPFLLNNLSNPEWNSILRFYGFDKSKKMPMVSDNSGFLYIVDPVSFKAEKTSSSVQRNSYSENPLTSSVKFDNRNVVYLKGSPRNHLQFGNKDTEEPSFLKGEIIRSSQEADVPEEYLLNLDEAEMQKNSLRKIDDLFSFAEGEIITSDKCIFLLSQTDVTDKAKVIISKVKIDDNSGSLQWETLLENIYREPDKAIDKSEFDIVFSKGSPNLRTMRVATGDNKLVLIYMLKATCIDMISGKVLWSIDL